MKTNDILLLTLLLTAIACTKVEEIDPDIPVDPTITTEAIEVDIILAALNFQKLFTVNMVFTHLKLKIGCLANVNQA